jgi:hypothetical protein
MASPETPADAAGRGGAGSHMTRRWREMDSNPRSPRKGQHFFETAAEPGDDEPAG